MALYSVKDAIRNAKSLIGEDWSLLKYTEDNLVEIQTPQIFEYEILEKAYLINVEEEMISHDTTQQVSKNLNIESKVILGSDLNLKITYKEDLETIKLKLEEYGNK